ncbi:leucine-rich repeat flightless-interacting protein 2-like [Tachysurus ichikawai]
MVSDVDDVRVPQSDSAVPEAPLTETEEKYKLVIASCTQLKKEMAGLMSEVNTVHDLVEELKKERLKKQLQNEELVMECQMKSVAISILEAHDKAIRSSLQKEFEEKRQAHSELKNQCDQMKKTLRGKKVSLADIEEQYQDLVRSGNNMVCQVKSLILEVYQAKKQQQVRLENNKVRNDHNILKSEYEQMKKTHKMKQEQTQEVHSNLKAQHTTMMDIFKQFYELLENHLKHEEPEEPQEPGEPGDPQEPRKAEEPGETGEPEEPRKS